METARQVQPWLMLLEACGFVGTGEKTHRKRPSIKKFLWQTLNRIKRGKNKSAGKFIPNDISL
jgi:hypothetical protein